MSPSVRIRTHSFYTLSSSSSSADDPAYSSFEKDVIAQSFVSNAVKITKTISVVQIEKLNANEKLVEDATEKVVKKCY